MKRKVNLSGRILACPECGEPNGKCHGGKPVPMTKEDASRLAFYAAEEELAGLLDAEAAEMEKVEKGL